MDPLVIDVYADDLGGKPDWLKYVAAGPPWHGAILKATEGTYYNPPWFATNWPAVRTTAGARYGVDFWRGCYHFLRVAEDGTAQARFFCGAVKAAGDFGPGDFYPMVDVERAENAGVTAQQTIACVSAFVAEVKALTGRECILYGGSFLIDLGVKGLMGCSALWIPRYAALLDAEYDELGVDLAHTLGWQYKEAGGPNYLISYPGVSPIGDVDTSALIIAGGGAAALQWLSDHACGTVA